MAVITGVMQDYLKAVYKLQRARGSASTTDLAERLGVSAASATNMSKRLAHLRLAVHTPYRGLVLTSAGERIALETIRHHRLLELYLAEHLGVSLDRVDDEADRLEHVLSEDVEAKIAAMLGNPTRDPHGDPIPAKNGAVRDVHYPDLTQVSPGERGVVDRVSDRRPDVVRRLTALGVLPGVAIRVLARLTGRRVRVDLDGEVRVLTHDLAEGVYVR